MTPYRTDFIPDSIQQIRKVVEVADGYNVPANHSGTVIIKTKNDAGKNITLRLLDVLHVPNLERRLFSLLSLIDQNHDVKLSKRNGVQIYLHNEKYPISLPMPNYHLFASSAKSTIPTDIRTSPNKIKIPLELLYMRMGCRNIKTLLSANQAELWKDTTIVISNDIISENDHHIATIRKHNRNMSKEPNPKLKPGDVLCLDII